MARALAGTGTPSEGRSKAMIGAAVIFAAIAAILLFVALQSRDDKGSSVADTAQVVVAAQNISANTELTADMLEVKTISTDQMLSGAYTQVDTVVGVPARYPLQQGEQVTSTKLGIEAIRDEKDLALVLQKGQRGFAVEAEEVTAVGGLLLPGNFVDVIAVFGEETGGVEKTVTVLQNVEVLSVAQEAQEPVPAAADDEASGETSQRVSGQRPEELERQPRARSVTLAVTPEQVQLLASLQSQDDVEIWLALRPVDDDEAPQLGETNLLQFHSPPLPQQ